MLKITLNDKTICYIPQTGLFLYQLYYIREYIADKEGCNIDDLNVDVGDV